MKYESAVERFALEAQVQVAWVWKSKEIPFTAFLRYRSIDNVCYRYGCMKVLFNRPMEDNKYGVRGGVGADLIESGRYAIFPPSGLHSLPGFFKYNFKCTIQYYEAIMVRKYSERIYFKKEEKCALILYM